MNRDITITRGARLAAIGLLVLVLIVGAGNLLASWYEVHSFKAAQQRQGELVEAKICATLGRMAALTPPGNAAANPSRAYEQQLHGVLDSLGPDLGCR